MDLFGGVETVLQNRKRAATWRGVHISLYSAGRTALENMFLLPLASYPAFVVPVVFIAAVELYHGHCSDEKIRQHAIPNLYRAAWRSFVLQGG